MSPVLAPRPGELSLHGALIELPQHADEGSQGGWNVAVARVVEAQPWDGRAPVLQDGHEPSGFDGVARSVEPGPTATRFGDNIDRAQAMSAYDGTPSGDMRRAIDGGLFTLTGDAARTVGAMIAAGDAERPPLRLALTSTAYGNISKALTSRLATLEAQKVTAFAADRDGLA